MFVNNKLKIYINQQKMTCSRKKAQMIFMISFEIDFLFSV